MKRQEKNDRDIKDDNTDRLNDLPDHILLHIIEFMSLKHSIQTCMLSKRWKNLWKNRSNLLLQHFYCPERSDIFNKFVSHVFSCRDDSTPLHSLNFEYADMVDPPKTLLLEVMEYAASHNVQQLTVSAEVRNISDLELPPSIFYCHSLTYLKLGFWHPYYSNSIIFPKSLNLPALKTLHLLDFTFTTSDNGCAEPFSACNMLNTLVIIGCYLQDDAQTLCISNSTVSNLTIATNYMYKESYDYKVVFCTPNLTSLTTNGRPTFQAPTAYNLPFLEEVNIDYSYYNMPYESSVLVSWLQLLTNVKTMKLCFNTLIKILSVISAIGIMKNQTPCFVRLKSLKVELESDSRTSDETVRRMVKYLLQNSPPVRVDIIRQA